mmetsp:Transcript_529/g.982  ORF Transcript_529/g.982 Transcript_529/m.982 type:complete len:418 (-) Transcript_529:1143-2396(-)|eukprot:CAMPEP_0113966094 /NCGR_PEP_ID=MMETSP0011_2-20120614/8131_1 /TAXON_ID=101924 /ORGANISM="Rhodosorus marinus" /LENGTH=417 /DNA_ID=CAMNT_0000978723 /DNA_START=79 /DNA_END=1332 /DNA_ORIENTATION=+ /assembly_acc=CAM_ASM_000156
MTDKEGRAQSEAEKLSESLQSAQISDGEAKMSDHRFWNTQPVPQYDEDDTEEIGPIDPVQSADEIQKTPYPLLGQFEWSECTVEDPKEIDEIYRFLNSNYVEDDDAMFRFDYGRDFLQWALMPPGWRKEWHVGVRVKQSRKLVGFITAIPARLSIHGSSKDTVEIDFLCIHKKLRSKRLAPVLIKEITRRVNLVGIFQAVYTAGVLLPRPLSRCRYHHRSLNPKKLIKVGFSRLAPRMTMMRTIKVYKLPEKPETPGFRRMEEKDVDGVLELMRKKYSDYKLAVEFSKEEVVHWILPHENVVYSYVVEDPETKQVIDFCSFYLLPSSIIQNTEYDTLSAAYLFYYVVDVTRMENVMRDLLIEARNVGCDVFNALDVMENKSFLKDLKFHIGDGELNYYLYNWKCPRIEPEENGLVML